MKHSHVLLAVFSALSVLLIAIGGCVEETGSLYDPNADKAPQPTVSSIVSTLSADSATADYDTLTITGTGFTTDVVDNWVFYNDQVRSPFFATETELQMRAPREIGDSISVRVARRSSTKFSTPYMYKVGAAVKRFSGLNDTSSHAMAFDASGDIFVALSALGPTGSRGDAGIHRVTPDGGRSRYGSPTPGLVNWTGLRMGAGGYLYAVRNQRAIYRINPGGGSATPWAQITSPSGVLITEIEFDQNGNLWAGGNNAFIFCVRPDRTNKASPFNALVRSLRIYNNSLYISALANGENQIWRAPILGDSLGAAELYFDFSAAFPGYTPNAITLSSDGYLFIATNAPEGIVVVSPGGMTSTPYVGYTDLMSPSVRFLTWGSGVSLFGSSSLVADPPSEGLFLRFHTRQTGAPYYGQ